MTLASTPAVALTDEQRWSIDLSVAQYLRSARAVVEAQERLAQLGVSSDELLRRRRAESADRGIARLLRLAVTLIITRGRLDRADRRRLPPGASEATIHAVVAATAEAYARVLVAESAAPAGSRPAIDMNVGDY
ncbi:hypothetical protein WPS_02600 [Vulcanimicrobium alpinum]|uniref:Uncharacterized protein n=1 Tax=Vulcanimicrobium alpinum TaxID=3016050 RepID=A0AAN1XSM4_UNVUL|nr:hypothetical protein [Vulcanimicrobium alpinum]BDE04984.1 hypothetical protein WPS_02600 [Vulcanimicrobium alpinum]